ncbi:MAG: TonB-dependent receptor, partial [Caulobacter sp.]|nr:TonB-dependent receptor [Caulobacter sp.]
MTFTNRRRGMLCSAAFVALAAAAPVFAADEPAPAPAEGEVTEVIITATRRAEALQDVPLAVTALSGERVEQERIQNFTDIPALVPGATFVSTKGPSTANVQIRGQQTTNDSPHLELPVAVFMDDVYYGTLASFSADFFDIDQLAILRGPQGTTFGRNVVGGALQITSKRPQIGVTDGEVNLGLSKYDTARDGGFEARGYVNAAVSDTVAARLAFSLKDIGGYSQNRTTGTFLNDQNSWALRPSLRFQ